MNLEEKKFLLGALKNVYKNPNCLAGICYQVESQYDYTELDLVVEALICLFVKWPKFSGQVTYPVRHPILSPFDAYQETHDMWDKETEYGRNRWELLEFCINELEKEINDA